jgi:hypothetical protein
MLRIQVSGILMRANPWANTSSISAIALVELACTIIKPTSANRRVQGNRGIRFSATGSDFGPFGIAIFTLPQTLLSSWLDRGEASDPQGLTPRWGRSRRRRVFRLA